MAGQTVTGVPANADGITVGKPVNGGLILPIGRQALPRPYVGAPATGDIRWEDYNYPPVLRLIHFDVSELPLFLRKTARLLNFSFLLTILCCALNFVDTLVLVGYAGAPVPWAIQSALHLVLLPSAALLVFYLGYRGIAAPEALLVQRFQGAQLALAALSFLFAVVPWHCVNGLLRLTRHVPPGTRPFWTAVIIIESTLWWLNAFVALMSVLQVRRHNLHVGSSVGVVGKV